MTWKQILLIAAVCYGTKLILGGVLPNVILAVLEIVGLATLILGIIGGTKAALDRGKNPKQQKPTERIVQ